MIFMVLLDSSYLTYCPLSRGRRSYCFLLLAASPVIQTFYMACITSSVKSYIGRCQCVFLDLWMLWEEMIDTWQYGSCWHFYRIYRCLLVVSLSEICYLARKGKQKEQRGKIFGHWIALFWRISYGMFG